jgi:hypothetical protein
MLDKAARDVAYDALQQTQLAIPILSCAAYATNVCFSMNLVTKCFSIASPGQIDAAECLMPDRQSPTLRRRRLAQELRRLRDEARSTASTND